MIYSEIKKLGIEITDSADTVLHICHPSHYRPIIGKRNVILTMTEHDFIANDFILAFESADAIITPSNYCVEVFRKYTKKPIFMVPLGIDTKLYTPKKRRWRPEKGEPFVWLYVGAPNLRKFSILEDVWKIFLRDLGSKVKLYLKTTGSVAEEPITKTENWIVDNRRLSDKELAKLYHSAHGFVLLHLGEGFGLTLVEAMATSLPCVVSDHTATKDFISERTGYPVKVNRGEVGITLRFGNVEHETDIETGIPDLTDAIKQMGSVMVNYDEATDRAREGSKLARKLTWESTAKNIVSIIERLDSPRL